VSYILNALRKSDAQRRLGQTPDLGDAPQSPQSGGGRGRKRRLLWLALAPLFVLTVALGWLLADPLQRWLDDSPEAGSVAESQAMEQSAEQSSRDESGPDLLAELVDPAPAEEDPTARPEPERPAMPGARARPTPQRAVDVPRERERVVQTPEEAQRLIDEALADSGLDPTGRETTRMTRVVPERPAPQREAPSVPERPDVPTERPLERPAETAWAPARSEFVRQWELPLSVRRDLPSLNLSIHVFSTEPESRFVLINGERRVEGDQLGQGAQLVEIRREGALVQFRDYRFLLEP